MLVRMTQTVESNYIVVGAGMAGASAAAHLAQHGRVIVLEREAHAGYHSTGRSAALFSEIYGNQTIRGLTRASRAFLFDPPAGFAGAALVHPRSTLFFASAAQLDALHQFHEDEQVAAATQLLSAEQARERVPVFRPGYLAGAALDSRSADIDVDTLHQGYLRMAKARGAHIEFSVDLRAIERTSGLWCLHTGDVVFRAPVLINAAGAWADQVAALASVTPLGLQALRRTAVLVEPPAGAGLMTGWPAAIDVEENFYFKPDAGLLLLSPADETPSPPCDVQPEELDVAIAVDHFEQATGGSVRRVMRRWAGLRVFTTDRSPALGFDAHVPGFFWLAGQGGYGIQTAPAMGECAAALARGSPLPTRVQDAGVRAEDLSPSRFTPRLTPNL
jgi:D-arginine dehydrogenase